MACVKTSVTSIALPCPHEGIRNPSHPSLTVKTPCTSIISRLNKIGDVLKLGVLEESKYWFFRLKI